MNSSNGFGRCMHCYGYLTTSGMCGCQTQTANIDPNWEFTPERVRAILLDLQKAQHALNRISEAGSLDVAIHMANTAVCQTGFYFPSVDSSLYDNDFDYNIEEYKAMKTQLSENEQEKTE